MARIVVAGAGATGASIAFHLASLGARDVVLADKGRVAGGATAKAMGGVRQQFSTAAEVRLAQASIRFFEELGMPAPAYSLGVGSGTHAAQTAEMLRRLEQIFLQSSAAFDTAMRQKRSHRSEAVCLEGRIELLKIYRGEH